MAEPFRERVWTDNHGATIELSEQVNTEGDPVLELTVDQGDEYLTAPLGDYAVRQLRLALTRYERKRKAAS